MSVMRDASQGEPDVLTAVIAEGKTSVRPLTFHSASEDLGTITSSICWLHVPGRVRGRDACKPQPAATHRARVDIGSNIAETTVNAAGHILYAQHSANMVGT